MTRSVKYLTLEFVHPLATRFGVRTFRESASS
jgi:hypothetical protein